MILEVLASLLPTILPSKWCEIQQSRCHEQMIDPSGICRVGMVYLFRILTVPKYAKTGLLALGKYFPSLIGESLFVHVIVGDGTLGLVLSSVEIVVEIAAIGGIPRDVGPAHAGFEPFDLLNGGAADDNERRVPSVQVTEGQRNIVREKGAAAASSVPGWVEHKVIDDKLLAVLEEVKQGQGLSSWASEGVVRCDLDQWHVRTQGGKLVCIAGVLLFFGEKVEAGSEPFLG